MVPSGSYLFVVGELIPFSGTRNQTVGFGLTAAGSEQKILALLSFQAGSGIPNSLNSNSLVLQLQDLSPQGMHARLSLWFQ